MGYCFYCDLHCIWLICTLFVCVSGNGGDANIQDETRKSPLHRLAILSQDVRMFKLLCDNGAHINSVDCRGNSPLLSLCDLSASEMYDYMEDLSPCSIDTIEDTRESLSVKRDYFSFILQQKDIQVWRLVKLILQKHSWNMCQQVMYRPKLFVFKCTFLHFQFCTKNVYHLLNDGNWLWGKKCWGWKQ